MSQSKRPLAILMLCSLLTATAGQALLLSAAPREQSMSTLSHAVRTRLACSWKHRPWFHASPPKARV